jgi:hypothetical protein
MKGGSQSPSQLIDARIEELGDAIDLHEGDAIDEEALNTLVRAAVALTESKAV